MSKLLATIKMVTGFDKFNNLVKIIDFNGGVLQSLKNLYLHDDLKMGTHVGTDQFGNKYYENPYYFVPRNRWVQFNESVGIKYDSSMIPPEWHRWMTHMTEYPPTVEKPVKYDWMEEYKFNQTGTNDAYVPYNTVRPKIQAWSPQSKIGTNSSIQGGNRKLIK